MATLVEFASRMHNLSLQMERGVVGTVKQISKNVLREVVKATPVDTGAARSNWQVGLNAAPSGPIRPYSPGRHLGRSETSNANAAISIGSAIINAVGGDGTIYISNNVPYINILNNPPQHSKQSPANFVEIAARKAVLGLRNVKVLP